MEAYTKARTQECIPWAKAAVQHYVSKILTEHEWATTILHGEAVHGMEQGRPKETEHTMAPEQDSKRRPKNRDTGAE